MCETADMYLKRKLYQDLLSWKKRSNGKTALLIEGARRTGKSFLVRDFAEKEYASCIYIDFSNAGSELEEIFRDTEDLNFFFIRLQAYAGVRLESRKSAVIFDEVQQFPKARQLIKHLVADGRYDFIETGSLIGLRKNVENIVIPSEEEVLYLYPIDFEEFLWALEREETAEYIWQCFREKRAMGDALHRRTMNLFRQYLMTGGMPQSVVAYCETKEFQESEQIKRNILRLYRSDIAKFAKGYEARVAAVYDDIPSQLSRHEKRFNLSSISRSARMRTYEDAFLWLSEARIVNMSFNATDPTVGLNLSTDRLTFKCYSADTGLLISQAVDNGTFLEEEVLRAVTYGKLNINEGMLMENAVAQMLTAAGHRLFFYSRPRSAENENSKAIEVDFLIRQGKKISPVEVKSSDHMRHASLDAFSQKFSEKIGTRYVITPKDLRAEGNTLYLPLYMTMCL